MMSRKILKLPLKESSQADSRTPRYVSFVAADKHTERLLVHGGPSCTSARFIASTPLSRPPCRWRS